MDDFKLKIVLSILGGVVFSLLIILLAFALPLPKDQLVIKKRDANKLELISETLRNK